jgi:imidazolonepropionase-like amidohydrolase
MWRMNKALRWIGLIAVGAAAARVTATPNVPPPAQTEPIMITGATIHTVPGTAIQNGRMLFRDGRIAAIGGPDLTPDPAARVVDLAGLHVYPSLINANTTLGLAEIEAVRATLDVAEPGPVNPNVRAERALNPDSDVLPVVRANGVLVALAVPKRSADGLIVGQSAAIVLDGWTYEDMTIEAPIGLHVFWPTLRIPDDVPDERRAELLERRDARLELLDASFEQAAAYRRARAADPGTAIDVRWEAMIPVLEGRMPLFAHADDLLELRHALDFAARFGLKLVIVGGADAWRIAGELATREIPVIVARVNRSPSRRWEAYSTPFENPAKLAAAGVKVAIAGDGTVFDAPHARNLPYDAAKAVAFGLTRDQALASITQTPAQILGIDDRLGTLEVGKDATFIVTTGDPLDTFTSVRAAFVRGRELDLGNRQTTLYEKYRERLQQLGMPNR